MNQKEMIEEMKQILIDWAIKNDLCFSFDIMQKHSEVLIKNGYRKIPEGSVVLTKEEYEKLTAPKVFISPKSLGKKEFEERIKNISNYGIIGVDESSIEIIPTRTDIKKETAKEILTYIIESGIINTAPQTIRMYFKENYEVEE